MSLSFVSKSVQTGTEDGNFVEEAIVPEDNGHNERDGGGSTGTNKPLFEQLRDNQEQAEAEREEYQRAMMRGTLALDEEDAAHLDSLRRQETQQRAEVRRKTEEELAAFRAARAERVDATIDNVSATDIHNHHNSSQTNPTGNQESAPPKSKVVAPPIMRRIKRKLPNPAGEQPEISKKSKEADNPTPGASAVHSPALSALGSLLAGYGSSSDEEDE